jgi:hypothetical protein
MAINKTSNVNTDKTIGAEGLEQGGANLGNDYSTPTRHVEQNETTNVGKGNTSDDEVNIQKAEYSEGPTITEEIKTPRDNS